MSQNEEKPKAELAFARDDWERLVSSLERLMALQRKTLQRLKALNRQNDVLSRKLRGTSAPPASRSKPAPHHRIKITSEVTTASREPEREVTALASVCVCGRELASGAKFCDRCGRSL